MQKDLNDMQLNEVEDLFEKLTHKYTLGTKLQIEVLQDLEKTRKTIEIVATFLSTKLQKENNG